MAGWLFVFVGFALACAVSVPPAGGPEDKQPPRVLGTVPRADSVGVSPEGPIVIAYDERMTIEGYGRNVAFSPPVEIDRVRWKGATVSIFPYGALHPDTTYVVSVRAGIRDAHNVATKAPFEFAFATSAAIDTGQVLGTVRFTREVSADAVVHCFVLPRDSSFVVQASQPDRRAASNEKGAYVLRYLPANGRPILVWAYQDRNHNGAFDPEGDVGMLYPDTLRLLAESPVRSGVDFAIVDPTEPAVVRGLVINESGIDSVVSVGLFAESDTIPARYYTLCDATGAFEFKRVLRGAYHMVAFIDLLADSMCATYPCAADSTRRCQEPCAALPDSVFVEPGDKKTLEPLRLSPAESRP